MYCQQATCSNEIDGKKCENVAIAGTFLCEECYEREEFIPFCKYELRWGRLCGNVAIYGDFCDDHAASSDRIYEPSDLPMMSENISTSSDHRPTRTCNYQFKKGDKKGMLCGKPAEEHGCCNSCVRYRVSPMYSQV